jgi:hypothetical protein
MGDASKTCNKSETSETNKTYETSETCKTSGTSKLCKASYACETSQTCSYCLYLITVIICLQGKERESMHRPGRPHREFSQEDHIVNSIKEDQTWKEEKKETINVQ